MQFFSWELFACFLAMVLAIYFIGPEKIFSKQIVDIIDARFE